MRFAIRDACWQIFQFIRKFVDQNTKKNWITENILNVEIRTHEPDKHNTSNHESKFQSNVFN
jgi:hypothetical protein